MLSTLRKFSGVRSSSATLMRIALEETDQLGDAGVDQVGGEEVFVVEATPPRPLQLSR
ncbi:MAG: hypothetical protein U0R26_09120 [Solirubrobacterales bacterium]